MNAEQMKEENKQGACDCPHKENCHLTRQFLADEYKKQHGIKCDFIKYFERRKTEEFIDLIRDSEQIRAVLIEDKARKAAKEMDDEIRQIIKGESNRKKEIEIDYRGGMVSLSKLSEGEPE